MAHSRTDAARSITAAGLARLLARLDADPDRAAAEYQRLRLTLVKFFDWRGAWPPDECADETLDRLVVKLEGDTSVEDVRRYAHGIARLVLLERLREQAQHPIGEYPDLSQLRAPSPAASGSLHDCFERCLASLSAENQAQILAYYSAEGRTKIDNRRRLARAAGVSDSALRSRMQRVRNRLERCTARCAAAADTVGLDAALRHVTAVEDTVQGKASDED
jgi:DNA-directed RNA polymerase specialized sigma24 family protein